MRSKDQRYSDEVFNNIQQLIENKGQDQTVKRYKSLCKRAGSLLRTVGLIQFLSFLQAKATKDSEVHCQYLLNHLLDQLDSQNILRSRDDKELSAKIRQQSLADYMFTTRETLRFLQWHKRIADILIQGTADGGDA